MVWRFADATTKLRSIVIQALAQGLQRTRHRGDQRLTGERETLKEFLLNGPDVSGLDLSRDETPGRVIAQ